MTFQWNIVNSRVAYTFLHSKRFEYKSVRMRALLYCWLKGTFDNWKQYQRISYQDCNKRELPNSSFIKSATIFPGSSQNIHSTSKPYVLSSYVLVMRLWNAQVQPVGTSCGRTNGTSQEHPKMMFWVHSGRTIAERSIRIVTERPKSTFPVQCSKHIIWRYKFHRQGEIKSHKNNTMFNKGLLFYTIQKYFQQVL